MTIVASVLCSLRDVTRYLYRRRFFSTAPDRYMKLTEIIRYEGLRIEARGER